MAVFVPELLYILVSLRAPNTSPTPQSRALKNKNKLAKQATTFLLIF
jgi:hypothetical protein